VMPGWEHQVINLALVLNLTLREAKLRKCQF
jgi:hypothetical protein